MKFKHFIAFLFLISSLNLTFGQYEKILKENLSPKARIYWDNQKKHLQAIGSYYVNEEKVVLNKTEKHGLWQFYSYDGILEEDRMHYRNRIHGKQIVYFPSKKVKTVSFFTYNVPDSTFKEYNEDGKLIVSGNYILGSPDGKWEYFYNDGRAWKTEEVINDTVYLRSFWEEDSLHKQTVKDGNGFIKSFYTNGVAKELYTFKEGLKTGIFEERTANGVLSVAGEFINGKKNGPWEYYFFDGTLEKKENFINDSLHGNYVVYYSEGKIDTEGTYNLGKKTGKWTWNTENGNVEMTGSFADDKQDGKWEYYYPDGGLSYTANYDKGKKTGTWRYLYENGKEFKKGDFVNDQKEGLWQTWYETGTLLMAGSYHEGKETGDWQNYWDNGKLKNKSTFKKGMLNGEWFSYTPDGTLVLEGHYKKNLQVKEWRDYYNNGRLKEVNHYKILTRKNYSNGVAVMGMKETVSEPHGKYEAYSQIDFQIKAKGQYKNGVKHGTWYDYYPGGVVPTIISEYKKGKLHGTFKQLGRRGEVMHEISYKDGLKDGLFTIYTPNGQIAVQKMFSKGHEMRKKEGGSMMNP
jgi:antitoxin component YwqK of YwqJK toxin-antitoxin module